LSARILTSDICNYPNYSFLQPKYIVANWGIPPEYYIIRQYGVKIRKVNHSQWFLWHVRFNCPDRKIVCTQFMFGDGISRYLNLSVALHSCLTCITIFVSNFEKTNKTDLSGPCKYCILFYRNLTFRTYTPSPWSQQFTFTWNKTYLYFQFLDFLIHEQVRTVHV